MRNIIMTVLLSAILGTTLAGCGESEESKRNLAILAREAEARKRAGEKAEVERRQKIEEARKWHRIQLEAYEKSMIPEKK